MPTGRVRHTPGLFPDLSYACLFAAHPGANCSAFSFRCPRVRFIHGQRVGWSHEGLTRCAGGRLPLRAFTEARAAAEYALVLAKVFASFHASISARS